MSLKGELYGTSWYQFTLSCSFPPDARVTSWSKDGPSSDTVRAAWSHVGDDPKPTGGNPISRSSASIQPGKTATLLESKGKGSIASLKLRMAPYSEETFFQGSNTDVVGRRGSAGCRPADRGFLRRRCTIRQ